MKQDYVPDQEEIEATKKSIVHWKKDILELLGCGSGDGIRPWSIFIGHRNPETARAMIQALEEILPAPKPFLRQDKPSVSVDSFTSVQDVGEIVKLFRYHWIKGHGLETWMDIAQAIEAEIASENQARKEEDKALRKLFRNHEERIKEVERQAKSANACFRRGQASSLDYGIKDLERKVGELEKGVGTLLEKKQRVDGLMSLIRETQPPQDVAVAKDRPFATAPDEYGEPHILRPGRSVCQDRCMKHGLFLDRNPKKPALVVFYSPLESGHLGKQLWSTDPNTVIWLRDLSFPSFDKSQDMGGDQ